MTLSELLKATHETLAGHPTGATPEHLGTQALAIANLTGWATGPIDPEGRLDQMLSKLMTEARARFDQTSDEGIARLHDGLAELREAVARHDQDLSPASMDEDDGEPL